MTERDPRVTDLRRYRRERERARRAQAQQVRRGANEPLLGRRRNAGMILVLVVLAVIAMTLLSHVRF